MPAPRYRYEFREANKSWPLEHWAVYCTQDTQRTVAICTTVEAAELTTRALNEANYDHP